MEASMHRSHALGFGLLLSLALTVGAAPADDPPADLIFHNGQVVTVDATFSMARALAVRDGRILAVGDNETILRQRGPDTRVVDLDGRTLIPGLIDTHIHFLPLGRDIREQAELGFAMTATEIVEAVAALKARREPAPGEWLVGNRWDQYKYPEMVTRWQLDAIAPDHPVYLSRVYRGVAVNTAVFRLMGIEDDRQETWPDWWLSDPADFTFEDRIYRAPRELTIRGEARTIDVPTGVFLGARGSALVTVEPPEPGLDGAVLDVRDGVQEMLRLGVTGIIDPSSRWGDVVPVYREAREQGYLQLRVLDIYEGTFSHHAPDRIAEHLDSVTAGRSDDPFLRWRGTKFYSDGGAGTRSAWVSESFDRWREFEGEPNHGYPVITDNAVRRAQYGAALDRGWQLHTHAAGDRAMRQAVDLYRELMAGVRRTSPDADLRWSLIHAYFPIEPATRVLEDMAALGIIAAANPVFQWQEGIAFATNVGEARMARMQPFRSYVKAGVIMASGSDYPVTSHDPWMGFYALLTRRDQATGRVFGPEETIGVLDALRSYTRHAAYLAHAEDWLGSLEPGKAADLVVLDLPGIEALERTPELTFEMRKRIVMTVVDGQVRYARE
jgi:predicted amidohydrolase YtcJ